MEYAVLIYGDEREWQARDEAANRAVQEAHQRFGQRCSEQGHKVTGGRELHGTAAARTVRRSGGKYSVTDGPFAETTEVLGGLYLIETDDLDGLLELLGTTLLENTFEVRPIVTHDV